MHLIVCSRQSCTSGGEKHHEGRGGSRGGGQFFLKAANDDVRCDRTACIVCPTLSLHLGDLVREGRIVITSLVVVAVVVVALVTAVVVAVLHDANGVAEAHASFDAAPRPPSLSRAAAASGAEDLDPARKLRPLLPDDDGESAAVLVLTPLLLPPDTRRGVSRNFIILIVRC